MVTRVVTCILLLVASTSLTLLAADTKVEAPGRVDVGSADSLPRASNPKPAKEPKAEAGWTYYGHCATNYSGGNPIPNTATAVSVYAYDVDWWYGANFGNVSSPTGNGASGTNDFQYPSANQFGIVVYQDGNVWQIRGTDSASATAITGLSNTKPFYIAVNDTKSNYGDNWGSYKIAVRVDAR